MIDVDLHYVLQVELSISLCSGAENAGQLTCFVHTCYSKQIQALPSCNDVDGSMLSVSVPG